MNVLRSLHTLRDWNLKIFVITAIMVDIDTALKIGHHVTLAAPVCSVGVFEGSR